MSTQLSVDSAAVSRHTLRSPLLLLLQVSTVFLLLSLAGWITFGVGFGLRNFEYSKEDSLPRATLYPDFTVLWMFGVSFPVLFVLAVVDLFCAYRLTTSLVSSPPLRCLSQLVQLATSTGPGIPCPAPLPGVSWWSALHQWPVHLPVLPGSPR